MTIPNGSAPRDIPRDEPVVQWDQTYSWRTSPIGASSIETMRRFEVEHPPEENRLRDRVIPIILSALLCIGGGAGLVWLVTGEVSGDTLLGALLGWVLITAWARRR